MIDDTSSQTKRHPIKVVALRTGLTPEVLRVWEKRYDFVDPERTPTARRLYSDDDIEHLLLLRRATQNGRRIGDIARMNKEQLEEMILEDESVSRPALTPMPVNLADRMLSSALKAVKELDPEALQTVVSQAQVRLGAAELIHGLLSPLALRIGELWQNGSIRPYHEHMASTLVIHALNRLIADQREKEGAPRLLVTTPAGQRHELGAILAATVAVSVGYNVLYLGPDLPAMDIEHAARQYRADMVGLSLVYPEDDPATHRQLRDLGERLRGERLLLVGGAGALSYEQTLMAVQARILPDAETTLQVLEELITIRS